MTRDDIIELARQTDIPVFFMGACLSGAIDQLERFAALVAAAERDACAVICDELESFWAAEKDAALLNGDTALSNTTSGEPRAARAIAQAIRARGESDAS